MKKKIISLMVMFLLSTTIISCGKNFYKNESKETNDNSIVIDENTKETVEDDNDFKISLIAKTDVISRTTDSGGNCFMNSNGEIIRYYPLPIIGELSLEKLEVGTISKEKDSIQGLNMINWEQKDLNDKYFRDVLTNSKTDSMLSFLDGKVYKIGKGGELKEITCEALTKNINNGLKLHSIDVSEDKSAVIYRLGNNEGTKALVIFDEKNDKYYEIEGESLENLSLGKINILAIEGNKIYMALYNSRDYSVTVGYFENNNFHDLVTFSENNDIKIQLYANILYLNNKLLFAGSVEDKSGIYNYDLNSKNLSPELITEDGFYTYIGVNPDNDKIIMYGVENNDPLKQFINVATLDENLEISNIKNIVTNYTQGDSISFEGWSENGEEIYIRNVKFDVTKEIIEHETSFEIYKTSK